MNLRAYCHACKSPCNWELTMHPYSEAVATLAGYPDWWLERQYDAGDLSDADLQAIELFRGARRG